METRIASDKRCRCACGKTSLRRPSAFAETRDANGFRLHGSLECNAESHPDGSTDLRAVSA